MVTAVVAAERWAGRSLLATTGAWSSTKARNARSKLSQAHPK